MGEKTCYFNSMFSKILAINSSVDKFAQEEIKILGVVFNKKGVDKINLINVRNKIENTLKYGTE